MSVGLLVIIMIYIKDIIDFVIIFGQLRVGCVIVMGQISNVACSGFQSHNFKIVWM